MDCQGLRDCTMCQGGMGLRWYENLGNYCSFVPMECRVCVCSGEEEGIEGDRDLVPEG